MRSSPKRRKILSGAGLVLLSVLAMVGTGTVARGHGPLAPGTDRVHTCAIPVAGVRVLRVVENTDICIPQVEQGFDFPQNGTLTGVDIGPANTVTRTLAPNIRSDPIPVSCPATPATGPVLYRVVGATVSHSTDASLSTSAQTTNTSWEVRLISPTGGAMVFSVAAICMRVFAQI